MNPWVFPRMFWFQAFAPQWQARPQFLQQEYPDFQLRSNLGSLLRQSHFQPVVRR